jgi:hypothetical protein
VSSCVLAEIKYDPKRLEAADRRLLLDEIARLEALVKDTRKKAPDRAGLARRLAEAYAELAALANREAIQKDLSLEELQKALARERNAEIEPRARPSKAAPEPVKL